MPTDDFFDEETDGYAREQLRKRVAASVADFHARMDRPNGLTDAQIKEFNRREAEVHERRLLAEYARLGIEPRYASDGVLISPAMLRILGAVVPKSEDGRDG